jgi:hypothetical protein
MTCRHFVVLSIDPAFGLPFQSGSGETELSGLCNDVQNLPSLADRPVIGIPFQSESGETELLSGLCKDVQKPRLDESF